MLCGDVASIAAESSDSSAKPQEMAECTKENPAKEGALCLLTADEDTGSIIVIAFGVAVLPVEAVAHSPVLANQFHPEITGFYLNPSLAESSPPPRV